MARALSKSLQKDYPSRPDIDESTLDRNTSLWWMAHMTGTNKRVLDVGCATGYLAKLMQSNGCRVTGMDINAEALKEAEPFCEEVIHLDLDTESLAGAVGDRRYDVVLFGDVLEHLRDPAAVLQDARTLLAQDGSVIVSIPNVAHGAIRLSLLQGRFNYMELGILDETHLRFFTRKTLDELFLRTGYETVRTERTILPLFEPTNLVPAVDPTQYPPTVIDEIRSDPEHETLQFVVEAKPVPEETRFEKLFGRFIAANTELEAATLHARRAEYALRRNLESADVIRSIAADGGDQEDLMRKLLAHIDEMARTASTERQSMLQRLEQVSRQQEDAFRESGEHQKRLAQENYALSAEVARLRASERQLQERVRERHASVEESQRQINQLMATEADLRRQLQELALERETAAAEFERQINEFRVNEVELRRQFHERVLERDAAGVEYERQIHELRATEAHLHERLLERHTVAEKTQRNIIRLQEVQAELRGRLLAQEAAVTAAEAARTTGAAEMKRLEAVLLETQARNERVSADLEMARAEASNSLKQLHATRSQNLMLQERFESAVAEKDALTDALERMRDDRDDLRGKFLLQTDSLLDRTRRETQTLSHLIELVQSSRFWSFKRALARLRPRRT